MNVISKAELIMALAQIYQDNKDNPQEFQSDFGDPFIDAKNTANDIIKIIESVQQS